MFICQFGFSKDNLFDVTSLNPPQNVSTSRLSAPPGGKVSDIFISLSPYFFPTSCFIWLPFHIICKEEYMWFYFLMMGVFFGYQVMSTIQETGSYQTDISSQGVVYSYFVFIPLYIVFHGIILAHLTNGFSGIGDFLIFDAYENGKMFFQTIKMQLGG
jgi:hypothetical protein